MLSLDICRQFFGRMKWDAFSQTEGTLEVRTARSRQSLSYPLRLPDSVQADALRLLDVSAR